MSEWIKKWNISKKEIIYLILPFILLLILFPTIIQPNHTLIAEHHDILLGANADLSVVKHPLDLWNNQWLTGLPAYADPLSNHYYPLLFPIFSLTQDIFIINLFLFAHLYLAYLIFFYFSGLVTKNSELRMVSALFYLFSGVLLSRLAGGHGSLIEAMTWIPLLYYAFFRIVWDDDLSVKNIGIIAISLALIFFTGAVYYLFYSCLILGVFFVYYFLKKKVNTGAIIALFSGFAIGSLILSIKLIPVTLVSGALGRIDIIDPLGDGGSLENNLASIIFGVPIDQVFGFYESVILIGIIPVLLVILALIFGREDRTIPAFFAIIVAFIWADGGNTLLSFIHLLPGLTNFRVAGRVLGALAPILILYAVYGFTILHSRIKDGESLVPSPDQKRNVLYAAGILLLVKVIELPFQSDVSLQAALSVIFIITFVGLLYFNKGTLNNILIFLSASCLIDAALIIQKASGLTLETIIKVVIILALVIAVLVVFNREKLQVSGNKTRYACIVLIVGLGIALIGNASYLRTYDPGLDESPALAVIEKIKTFDNSQAQIWVYETGWPIQHMDFTYWLIKDGIHPIRAYYPYFLNAMISPVYTIGGISYYTPDYFIDTAYLENGKQNLDNVTFKVNNISVYKPEHVLPNAFVIRDDQLIPAKIEVFTPDKVIITGRFSARDIAVMKSSFYQGWKVNGQEASNVGNMVGAQLPSDTTSVTFRYDPLDMKVATMLCAVGILLLIALIVKRRVVEQYLAGFGKVVAQKQEKRKKKA